jgi:hypothetical protein
MMNKQFWTIAILAIGFGFGSCEKEATENEPSSGGSTESGSVIAQDADAVLTIGTIETDYGDGLFLDYRLAQTTLLKSRGVEEGIDGASLVSVNGKEESKQSSPDIGTYYLYNGVSDFFDGLVIKDTNTWVIESNGSTWVEDLTISVPQAVPSSFGITANDVVDLSKDYNIAIDLSGSIGFDADTLLFAMSDENGKYVYKQEPKSVGTTTFTPADMSVLSGEQIAIQINAYKLIKRVVNGKNYYFSHQRGLVEFRQGSN